jgi:hypothetical protein
MRPRQRLLSPVGSLDKSQVLSVDAGALVRRLLIFDQLMVESIQLKEIPAFVKALGYGPTLELLDSGAVKIKCDMLVTAETGRTAATVERAAKGILGPFAYCVLPADFGGVGSPKPGETMQHHHISYWMKEVRVT